MKYRKIMEALIKDPLLLVKDERNALKQALSIIDKYEVKETVPLEELRELIHFYLDCKEVMAEDRNEQFAMHTKKAKELLILCGKDIHKAIFVVDQANIKWKSLPNWSWKGLINNCASLLGE
jgi:hypothetical protein